MGPRHDRQLTRTAAAGLKLHDAMNLFVADPHWGWWIILYFFLGGIAAGAYFMATLIELVGPKEDRRIARVGYAIAFPLIAVCGILLIVDLTRPDRFWHMLFRSEVVAAAQAAGWPFSVAGWRTMTGAPFVKYWSPMSVGSWALLLFGLCSLLSLLGSEGSEGRIARLLRHGLPGHAVRIVGCAIGFFVASYTGVLLTATNQPLWSDTVWIAPVFLTSAASTGIAAMILLGRRRLAATAGSLQRLERADLWALAMELVVFVIFLASLGPLLVPVFYSASGKLLIVGTLALALFIPLAIHLRPRLFGRQGAVAAATCVLVGGLLLRYALVTTPLELLAGQRAVRWSDAAATGFGPEAARPRGQRGSDAGNRPLDLKPRSKVFDR